MGDSGPCDASLNHITKITSQQEQWREAWQIPIIFVCVQLVGISKSRTKGGTNKRDNRSALELRRVQVVTQKSKATMFKPGSWDLRESIPASSRKKGYPCRPEEVLRVDQRAAKKNKKFASHRSFLRSGIGDNIQRTSWFLMHRARETWRNPR